ncbi:PTS sugar transporter subunit IIA [bacterium]|nr:PTS sugar transporter subunit IIA [bacterium]
MVYLKDYLDPLFVTFLEEDDKKSALNTMAALLSKSPKIEDNKAFKKAVFDRENLMSTGIGLGIAIPHVKIDTVSDIVIGIGITKKGIDWGTIDNKPVRLIFLIAGAEHQHRVYLQILSKIILVLKKKDRREKLLAAKSPEEVLNIFNKL